MKKQQLFILVLCFLWLALFSGGFWALDQGKIVKYFNGFAQTKFLTVKLHLYVYLSLIFSALYFWFFYVKRHNLAKSLSGAHVMPLVFLATVLTPTVLQTDQIRYIWDGIVNLTGNNPYIHPPKHYPFFTTYLGHAQLNHVELRTIYPPFAQIVFLVSCYLNPFMWNLYLGWEWVPIYHIDNYFQMEFGWKMICALMAIGTIWVFRNKRWDKLVFHPLFLMTWVGNGHVDVLICGFMALAIYGLHRGLIRYHYFLAAIFSKWLPILFFPAMLLSLFRSQKGMSLKSLKFVFLLMTSCAWIYLFYYYWQGAGGHMFSSSKTYANKWYFFGYFHHTFRDILLWGCDGLRYLIMSLAEIFPRIGWYKVPQWFIYSQYSEPMRFFAKILSLGIAAVGLGYVFIFYYLKKVTLRLYLFLSVFVLLAFFPNIHPWYLLILLVTWLPFHGIFISPPVWASLILCSKVFYADYEASMTLRYSVYLIVTYFAYFDFKRVMHQLHFSKLRKSSWQKFLPSRD